MTAFIAVPRSKSHRVRLAALAVGLMLALSSCTLFSSSNYSLITENFGTRRTVVLRRGFTGFLYAQLWNVGAAKVAAGLADQMYYPASLLLNAPWPMQSAADYTRSHPSDVSGAIVAAASNWDAGCVAFTFLPPYNWTNKKAGCR